MSRWVGRLIILNVLVLLLQLGNPLVSYVIAFRPVYVLRMPWTVVTYMFAHAGWTHLIFNMFGLWVFGPRVETRLGGGRFLALYLISGIAGAIGQAIVAPGVALVGASGAIFGVTFAFAYWWPKQPIYIWMVLPVEAWLLVSIYIALNLAQGITGTGGNVANFAHLGGVAGAFLYIKFAERTSAAAKWKRMVELPVPPKPLIDLERWKKADVAAMHPVNREEYERVLAKLNAVGLSGLTRGEIEFLERFSKMTM